MCFGVELRSPLGRQNQRGGVETTRRQDGDCREADLAPDQHGAEDDLKAVKEVVSDDDDCSAPCGPPLTGTDGFNAGRCSWKKKKKCLKPPKEVHPCSPERNDRINTANKC